MKMTRAQRFREWKVILKDDEDFDWIFIIRILRYKLERTRKWIVNNNIISDAKKVGKQIKMVEDLLKEIDKDSYYNDELKKIEAVYGKRNLKMNMDKKIDRGHSSVSFTSNWDKLPVRRKAAANRRESAAWERSHQKRQADIEKAFSLISSNLQTWWE